MNDTRIVLDHNEETHSTTEREDIILDSQDLDLSSRIKRLEDIEEIKRLKFRYCSLCDVGFDADELSKLFTEDAVWEAGEPWGNFTGPKAIGEFFRTCPDSIGFSYHAVSNGEIDVDGDSAKGRWRTIIPCSLKGEEGLVPTWMFCDYDEEYRRVNGRWLFSRVVGDVKRAAPHSDGWE